MPFINLYPLTPAPLQIDENGLAGKLTFDYDRENNLMVINFKFEMDNHTPVPVVVHLKAVGRFYKHKLFIIDYCNKKVKTCLFKPLYNIEDVCLQGIFPYVYRGKKPE